MKNVEKDCYTWNLYSFPVILADVTRTVEKAKVYCKLSLFVFRKILHSVGDVGSVGVWVHGWCGSNFGAEDMGSVSPWNFGACQKKHGWHGSVKLWVSQNKYFSCLYGLNVLLFNQTLQKTLVSFTAYWKSGTQDPKVGPGTQDC